MRSHSRRAALTRLAAATGILLAPALALPVIGSPARAAGSFRVLHIMSYHDEWQWNRDQFDAFRAELADLDIEYKVLELDMKRRSDAAWKQEVAAQARALIES